MTCLVGKLFDRGLLDMKTQQVVEGSQRCGARRP
jgi:hypothetical protein